ncbi:MAG: hypothetical protein PHE16_07165 [Aliarcobacter sp.]|nr:hypothetical protein [Aliarcobacter sp.]
MAITRQIIFLAKKDCIEELKALFKSTIIDSLESEEALNKHYETPHYSHFINNFNQYNAYIGPFELEIL